MTTAAIVCIDDEWDILKSLGTQLKRNFGKEYEIELANNGEEAIEVCAELIAEGKEIPLIISDQKMQGMTGDTLLVRLHALYPETLKIMLTGQTDAESVANVVNAAALYRYIAKPWQEDDLILTVNEALRRFRQERQITEQNESLKKINAQLKHSLSLFAATLEATADGIIALDNEGKIISYNQKCAAIWNFSNIETEIRERDFLDRIEKLVLEKDAIEFQQTINSVSKPKKDYLGLKNGKIIEYYLQPQKIANTIIGKVFSFRDVTTEKQTEAIIKYQAFHDALTNLPNRAYFGQKLTTALNEARKNSRAIALMFIDLDHFKKVNDTLGHAVGDLLLKTAVQRILGCLRDTDLLARWGGDEFVLLLDRISYLQDVGDIAERIVRVLQPKFFLAGHSVEVTASVGVALYPKDGSDSDTLLEKADSALYEAKKWGRNNYQYYSAVRSN
jgi:diguanylate cyclase (GGDEF)-like protein/PAS domain S-box-containing protein